MDILSFSNCIVVWLICLSVRSETGWVHALNLEIEFHREIFYPGQVISGEISLFNEKPQKLRSKMNVTNE